MSEKTLDNTTANQAKDQVSDIQFWGNGDAWKLLGKASSKKEGWMKSSKAYQIDNVGCIVQVTTQQGENVAEALQFIPDVKIEETWDDYEQPGTGKVISRRLVATNEPIFKPKTFSVFLDSLSSEGFKNSIRIEANTKEELEYFIQSWKEIKEKYI